MATFALVVHPRRPHASTWAEWTEKWLSERGHDVTRVIEADPLTSDLLDGPDAHLLVEPIEPAGPVEPEGSEALTPPSPIATAISGDVDLVISLGGDGTMLRAVAMALPHGIPVLGVNLGQLGYLTEVEPSGLEGALERFVAGDYEIRRLATLEVELVHSARRHHARENAHTHENARHDTHENAQPGDQDRRRATGPFVALNEVVVEKTAAGHTVRIAASVGGRPFMTYTADGVLVATPTGSTAYNLSVRGPLVSPAVEALVLTPIAPHTMFDRPLVLDPSEGVDLEVVGPRSGVLVVDGAAVGTVEPGDVVCCRKGKQPANVVSLGYRDFVEVLRRRFSISER